MRFPGATHPVLGFQYREDAERFLKQWQERMGKFGLELHPEKTRLIEFGRYATERRAKRGEGKPETFNFWGFTHICGTSQPKGYFTVRRKTIGKRVQEPALPRYCRWEAPPLSSLASGSGILKF